MRRGLCLGAVGEGEMTIGLCIMIGFVGGVLFGMWWEKSQSDDNSGNGSGTADNADGLID